jgi:hypothetical protein
MSDLYHGLYIIHILDALGPSPSIRSILHLEAGPICCVRGLKSSLVIGQKAQIGPNPFTPRGRADLVVCFFKLKNVCCDTVRVR